VKKIAQKPFNDFQILLLIQTHSRHILPHHVRRFRHCMKKNQVLVAMMLNN